MRTSAGFSPLLVLLLIASGCATTAQEWLAPEGAMIPQDAPLDCPRMPPLKISAHVKTGNYDNNAEVNVQPPRTPPQGDVRRGQCIQFEAIVDDGSGPAAVNLVHFINNATDATTYGKEVNKIAAADVCRAAKNPCIVKIALPDDHHYRYIAQVAHGGANKKSDPELSVSGDTDDYRTHAHPYVSFPSNQVGHKASVSPHYMVGGDCGPLTIPAIQVAVNGNAGTVTPQHAGPVPRGACVEWDVVIMDGGAPANITSIDGDPSKFTPACSGLLTAGSCNPPSSTCRVTIDDSLADDCYPYRVTLERNGVPFTVDPEIAVSGDGVHFKK